MTDKQEFLKKLKALAERGQGGEKINAQAKLNALMKKYGITEEELDDNCKQPYEFKCKNDIEEKLLRQTIYKVTNERGSAYGFVRTRTGRHIKHLLGCDCTKAQKLEIEFLFDFYKRTFNKDLKTLLDAFIQKHRIFGELKDGEEPQQIDPEELKRLLAMQDGLSNDKPQKQIEARGGGKQ